MTATNYKMWFFAIFVYLGRIACEAATFPLSITGTPGAIEGWWWEQPAIHYGQATPPAGDDFVAVAAGDRHSVALRTDGSLVAWGDPDPGSGYLNVPTGNDFVAISASYYGTLALRRNGTIVGWGYNGWGQLNSPPHNDFVAIAAGTVHSVGLRADGSVYAWGYDAFYPVLDVPEGNNYVAIASANFLSAALDTNGSIHLWGEVGGNAEVYEGPFVKIAASVGTIIALRADGTFFTTGGWAIENSPPNDLEFLATGNTASYAMGIRINGSLVAWGPHPHNPPAGDDFVYAAAGYAHGLAIRRVNNSPTAIAGPDQTLHCEGSEGASVTLDGSQSTYPDGDDVEYEWTIAAGSGVVLSNANQAMASGTFPVGVHEVTLTVYDLDEEGHRKGGVGVDSVTITVVDDDPPVALVTTDLVALLPANNTMRTVMVSVLASDQCTAPDDLLVYCTVSSNQPDNTSGNSNFVGDVDGQDGYSAPVPITLDNLGDGSYVGFVQLRAERVATDQSGRVYSINLDVLDAALNYQRASTTVVVPHSQRPQ